jgi:predicted DCC family thiol-disulfide oxidoreductase YuxK
MAIRWIPMSIHPWTKDVVIYDGECRFCRGQVERLKQFDPR